MTATVWAAVAILLVLSVALFLWIRTDRTRRRVATRPQISFDEEFAQEISPEPLQQPSEFVCELPRRYGQDRLALLVRDPGWLFAYWEVSATRLEAIRSSPKWRNARPVLRLYNVTGVDFNGHNALSFVDVPITPDATSWHIEVNQPNCSFCVDLGRLAPNGEFFTILRSNIVTTPRAALSDRIDEEWMWIEGIYRSIVKAETGVSSVLIVEELGRKAAEIPGVSSATLIQDRGEV
ncbi:MAG: DUF4912 domain-containing protein [Bacillota bacterium]|uniref:DUF4912 domain-containing protein n=1 Tax=Desulforudis sp. DRI-14 TaxID=3459793 RepID=UPI00348905AF